MLDASSRNKLSRTQLSKMAGNAIQPEPHKEIQFKFRDVKCKWNEPLIRAMDVGHGYDIPSIATAIDNELGQEEQNINNTEQIVIPITKKKGYLFDCIDLCIPEHSITCILGSNGCGKSTLLRILAGDTLPLEGKIHLAWQVQVCYFSQHVADDLIWQYLSNNKSSVSKVQTPLALLKQEFPQKSEHDLRSEMTAFGLNPKQQTKSNIKFLSGGERCRLCLANMMLRDPQVLILDEPTNHLDVESVEALIYGLQHWNGTVILVSHDANLIRSVCDSSDATSVICGDAAATESTACCYVLMENEGKLRRLEGGIDSYLKSF